MKRQFFRHGLVYGAANLIASAGAVVLIPIYTRVLRPEEYGIVDYLAAVQTLVLIVAGLELTQATARFYSAATSDSERRAYASTGLWFLVVSSAAVCLLLYAGARLIGGDFLGPAMTGSLLAVALSSVYARILFYALQAQARWELRSAAYAGASVVAVISTVALVAYLLLVREAGLLGVFAGLTAGYAAACAFAVAALRDTYRLQFDRVKFAQMLRFSLPLTVSGLALFFASYGDRFILRSALGFHDLGIYGVGARIAAVVTIAINGFQLGAAPLIYRHHASPEAPAALAQLMRLFLGVCLIAVVSLATFSIEIIGVVATAEYATAWRLIPLLSLAVVFANLYLFVPGLTIHHMTRRFALINICTAGVTLVLIALLVRVWGPTGVALGVLAGSATGFWLHAAASQRVYRIPIDWRRVAAGLVITGVTIAATLSFGETGVVSFSTRLVLFAAAVAALVAVLSTGEERAMTQSAIAARTSSWSRG